MTCKRIRQRTRDEQDYWLTFLDRFDWDGTITEAQRVEFLQYDSHGGEIPTHNPIYVGKQREGMLCRMYRDAYFSGTGEWPGGLQLAQEFMQSAHGLRPLIAWFGQESVDRWVSALPIARVDTEVIL